MNHIDDDNLLKQALQLTDEEEEKRLNDHILQCEKCHTRFDQIKHQIDIIGSVEPEIDIPVYPLPRAKRMSFSTWMRAAALLLLGFMMGYSVSQLSEPTDVNVIPQRLKIVSQSVSIAEFTSCEPVDLGLGEDWVRSFTKLDSLKT